MAQINSFQGEAFWKNYMVRWFGEELIAEWERTVSVEEIESGGERIGVEIYRTGDPGADTVVFAHGIAGYARILLPFLVPLFKRGINIVAPDLKGFGYNRGKRGMFTWDDHLINLRDSVNYARSQFNGAIYLGGASMGGPLAYATDARYSCADGLICWCLWDFADREFMNRETNTGRLTYPLIPLMKLTAGLMGDLRVKTYRFVSYDTLTDDPAFNALVKQDPQAGCLIGLKGAVSLVTASKPDLEHQLYRKPVLICQPEGDQMTPAYYSKKVFQKLQGEDKQYTPFNGGHFPIDPDCYRRWGEVVATFLKEQSLKK